MLSLGAVGAMPLGGLRAQPTVSLPPVAATAASGRVSSQPPSAPPSAAAPASADTAAGTPRREDPLQDPAVQRQIAQLAARDREVRAHEQAHVAAGGALITSGPTYTYQTGPDRRRYAVGGEVGIDTSPVRGDPEATLDKARRIRAAALAPAEPSSQDRQVAARATQMEQSARLEIARERRDQAYRGAAAAGDAAAGNQLSAVA